MKKLIFIAAIVFFSNCEIKVKEAHAQSDNFYKVYNKEFITIQGMEYMLLYKFGSSSQTGYDIEAINITKDKLEVELIKKQLALYL